MISEYDKEHIGEILAGHGDWFTAYLLRLFAKADAENTKLLRKVYPEVFEAYMKWLNDNGEIFCPACGMMKHKPHPLW